MSIRKQRIGLIMAITFLVAAIIFGRLLIVQVFNNDKYNSGAISSRLQEVPVVPDRGIIYDQKGEALAISVKRQSVFINPSEIRSLEKKDIVIKDLAKRLQISEKKVKSAVAREDTDFIWLKRHADKKATDALKKANYRGVGLTPEYNREYPKGRLASQVLGFAGIDNQGLSGAELQFNKILAGTPGKLAVEYDGKGNAVPQSIRESIPATPGDNLYLTIDGTIQYIVERELKKCMTEFKPLQITCIVQDVNTGQILAMAGLPDFNPNNYEESDEENWNNLAVSKVYEPGSVFKTVSTSMYLDDAVATPESQYYCPGHTEIDGHELRCWSYPKGQGAETLKQAVANSCNIAQAKSVARLGKDRFYDYLHGFGFTRKTGIDLPAESEPVLVPKDKAVPLDLAAMAIGQANAYTPIQMATAISAVANGGELMKPQILLKEVNRKNKTIKEFKPEVVRRVLSEHSAAQMRDMLEYVVTDGIGKSAAVPGYRVAGKTGTAEIARAGRYEKGDYNLSFGGFAPANDPKVTCLIVVNSPQTNASSGTVVGPIFSSIIGEIMRYYDIPSTQPTKEIEEAQGADLIEVPDVAMPMNAELARQEFAAAGLQVEFVTEGDTAQAYLPTPGSKVAAGTPIKIYCNTEASETVVLPDLAGLTIKEADLILSRFGLVPELNGSGVAWHQAPVAGSVVAKGSRVSVQFASTKERENIENLQEEAIEKEKKAEELRRQKEAAKQGDAEKSANPAA